MLSVIESLSKCQKLHHTLLHQPQYNTVNSQHSMSSNPSTVQLPNTESVASAANAATRFNSNVLLMTYHVLVIALDGSSSSGFRIYSFFFISELLVQALGLPLSQQQATIYGAAWELCAINWYFSLYPQLTPPTRKSQLRL